MDEIDAVSPAAAKRLFDDAIRGRAAPEYGTQLARLFMDRKLTAAQFETGRRWERLSIEYRHSIGAPPPYEKPGTLGSIGQVNGDGLGDDPAVDSKEGRALRERRLRFIGEMEAALAALGAAGAVLQALRHTVEQDKAPVGVAGLEALRAGLDRLGRLWGLSR